MPAAESSFSRQLSTDDFPERDRLAMTREVLSRSVFHLDIELPRDVPFRGKFALQKLPGLDVMKETHSPLRWIKSKQFPGRGNDSILFVVATVPRSVERRGREYTHEAGDGGAASSLEPSRVTFLSPCSELGLIVPRKILGPLLREKGEWFHRRVPANTPALRLLTGYMRILGDHATAVPELQRIVVAHVHDLLAITLGPTRDALETAKGRGVRAARLHAIKKDVVRNLEGDLSIGAVAARHKLTPRYVQMLFEDEGTTFSEFARDERLSYARSMLASPRLEDRKIADIAFQAGFNDLSYFNRVFRRRFGASPGEVRWCGAR